jgi:hypothetical protein
MTHLLRPIARPSHPRTTPSRGVAAPDRIRGSIEPEDEDLGDEEDLAVAQPLADEESSFDDFDDEFDDDFEEEENDPDWDHPDDAEPEEPPPAKGGGRK